MAHLYIFIMILLTVYGQIILKWRIKKYGALPELFIPKLLYLLKLIIDPYIFSGLVGVFIGGLFWMAAMTKLQLSYAYPFIGLTFILVLLLSVVILKEPLTVYKVIGIVLIVLGIFISSRSL